MASTPKSLTESLSNLTNLPNYTVRVSDRAKCVRLSLSVDNGLEVVIPANYDRHKIPDIVYKKRDWIAKHQHKLNERKAFLQAQSPHELPESITLRSLGEHWQIEYLPISLPANSINLSEQKEQMLLVVSGDITNVDACKALLKQWLMRKAEKHLFGWLRQVSVRYNLPYRTTTVRSQKTLWGSCSRDRNISLNYKLLFLEFKVVEYVLIHELCHTVHMNHSDKFWSLVNRFEPNYKLLDKSLNQAWKNIPAWLENT